MIDGFAAPNWEDETAYPDTNDTTPTQWAWQFLRRNRLYQTDWQRFAEAVIRKAKSHPETLEYATWFLTRTDEAWKAFAAKYPAASVQQTTLSEPHRLIFFNGEDSLAVFDPPLHDGESYCSYLQRVGTSTRSPLEPYLGRKWGLESIRNPNIVKFGIFDCVRFADTLGRGWVVPNIDFRSDLRRIETNGTSGLTQESFALDTLKRIGKDFGKPELLTITFNLSLPINEQVDSVRSHLKGEAQLRSEAGEMEIVRQPRYEARMYRNYLRAFDAKQAGAKHAQIVQVLLPKEAETNDSAHDYPPNKKVKIWLKTAERLVETGYRFIPLAANKAEKAKQKKCPDS
jgi:hypothetical protein